MRKLSKRIKINWKEVLWVLALMCLCFIILFMNRRLPFFASDEGDNFLGGKMVANGLDVYKEFQSQHMPIMYYICAMFYLLGAKTVIQFRLFFYAFLCVIWAFMYIRYSKFFGKIAMSLYPLLYICLMHFMDFGYSVLSEQMWAQGMVLLLLEYLLYIKQKKVSIVSACWISFAILISFGTAFMAAASIGVIFFGVLYSEISLQKKEKSGFWKGISRIWKRNWKMIAIVLIPFAILVLWYLVSGNLYNAYYGSFVVNREFYPNYMPSIQSALETLTSCFVNLKNWIWYTEQTEVYVQIMIFGIFLVLLIVKKLYSVAVCIFFFTSFCAIRGIDNFHALQLHAVFMIMAALMVSYFAEKYIKPKLGACTKKERIIYVGCFLITLAVACFPLYRYYYERKGLLKVQESESVDAHPEGYEVIDKLTEHNEKIYECILNPWYYFSTDTLPATTSAVCPWIYEAYKEKIFEDLEKEKPRIVSYSEDVVIWGYRFGDFASELCDYFKQNYTLLDGYTQVYVRNDYYEEAMKILAQQMR